MCNPALVAVVGLAISAAGAAYQGVQAAEQADAQKKAAELQLQLELEAIEAQKKQINAQAVEDMSDAARAARREAASLRVAAGESGVGGLSVQGLLDDVSTQLGFETSKIDVNRKNAIAQAQRDTTGARLRSSVTTDSANRAKTSAYVNSGLRIASSATSAYGSYSQATNLAAANKQATSALQVKTYTT